MGLSRDYEKGKKSTMGDLIDRQAAIDALHTRFKDGFNEDKWWNSTHVLAAIEGLPSAQPEIIRCKECIRYHEPSCLMVYDGKEWAEDNGFCHAGKRRTDE